MPDVQRGAPEVDITAEVLIIGAGAAGLTAALRARAEGAEVIVLERDESPRGSTSMSSGFVPAPGTGYQHAAGVTEDTPATFEADILAKSKGLSDPALTRLAATEIGPAVEWLGAHAGVDWQVLDSFLYPGHRFHRMHAVPEKTGAALEARLIAAAQDACVTLVTGARAETLHVDAQDTATAVRFLRPDGTAETVGCKTLVLACNGYGGNAARVLRHVPEIAAGTYYGHDGNTGHALAWGEALGAELRHLSGYQGHGSLAHPHGILISWALMMQGAVQLNADGLRFSNELGGYSEQAVHVLAQPGGVAWNVYDATRHAFGLEGFPDYREADAAGAIRTAADWDTLANGLGLPADAVSKTMAEVSTCIASGGTDSYGRSFAGVAPLTPPFHAVKVTGALFHTQGGLVIGDDGRVLRTDGRAFPNLYAAGGAACGVSGPRVDGYLSGNGLLTALAFGALSGREAARRTRV
ncbi:MAG: FAD-dependent oxidoreductase [Pseudomonadota bacterium]